MVLQSRRDRRTLPHGTARHGTARHGRTSPLSTHRYMQTHRRVARMFYSTAPAATPRWPSLRPPRRLCVGSLCRETGAYGMVRLCRCARRAWRRHVGRIGRRRTKRACSSHSLPYGTITRKPGVVPPSADVGVLSPYTHTHTHTHPHTHTYTRSHACARACTHTHTRTRTHTHTHTHTHT